MGKWIVRAIYGVALMLAAVLGLMLWTQHDALALAGRTLPELSFGPADARVTVVEFMDYRCMACRTTEASSRQIRQEFPDVKFVIRHFPIFGRQSVIEADMAITAARHGKFKEMHDLLIGREAPVEESEIPAILEQVGIDIPAEQFRQEMRQAGNGQIMQQTLDLSDRLGIRMAPTFIIGKEIYVPTTNPAPVKDLRALITAAGGGKTP